MIEWFVLLAIIILAVYLILPFTSYVSFGINIVLLISLIILINRDLKKKEMQRYYLISLLLTAIVFIFSDYGIFYTLFRILEKKLFLSLITIAFLLIYAFANIGILLTNSTKELIKKFS
jgi:hypothetical protein